MKINHQIEYDYSNGKLTFNESLLTDGFKYFGVEFEADPRWENDGIGGYEYWGQKCHDTGRDYVSLEQYGDPVWDKAKHTDEENLIIEEFKKGNEWNNLCDMVCENYKELSAD